jgi:hypothetical protein
VGAAVDCVRVTQGHERWAEAPRSRTSRVHAARAANRVQHYHHVAVPLVMPVTVTALMILGPISRLLFDLPRSAFVAE